MRRAVCALVAGLALMSPAAAHAGGAAGVHEVDLATGASLLTHGGDPPAASASAAPALAPRRRPSCAAPPHVVQVLYGRPATAPDRLGAVLATIEEAVERANGMLDRAASESGSVHADLRVACAGDRVQVNAFVNVASARFDDVVDAARLGGASDPDVDYLIFYDDPSPEACGVGSFIPDDRPGPDNANNQGGGYAVVYADCWDDGVTPLHEVAHTQGAVQPGAPNATGQSHCRDELDVMCYADGAQGASGGMYDRCRSMRFDCGYDDYFDAAPQAAEYLATHWNLGASTNRFVAFSPIGAGEDVAVSSSACGLITDPSAVLIAAEECSEPAPVAPEDAEEDHPRVATVRIVGRSVRLRGSGVRVRLACPGGRADACSGRLEVHRRSGRLAGRQRFTIAPGRRGTVHVRLAARTRRAWAAGAIRALEVVADQRDAPELEVWKVAVRGPRR